MRIAIGLRLSASRHLLCQQATSKHSDMVVPVHADVSPGPDKAVTFLVHSVYQMLLRNVVAQIVKVPLCLLFPAILQIPGPDPRGSCMPSSLQPSVSCASGGTFEARRERKRHTLFPKVPSSPSADRASVYTNPEL
jgi:hypothetical protein